MIKIKIFFLLVITIGIASCTANIDHISGKDTIAYTYKTFKIRDTACGNNPDSSCTIVKINYLGFNGHTALNDSVAHKFIGLFELNVDKTDTSLKQLADNFINRYHNFKKEQPKSTLYYLLDEHAKVLRQDSAIITIEVSGYSYHGGPHGVEYTGYVNWDIKANKSISLNDIFINGYQPGLNRIAEQIFRKTEKLTDTSSLNNQRTYFFKNNKFSLPDNYLIVPSGICFLYNVYTIKAYAAGKTKLLVPYDKIQSLLLPGTAVKK